jgi:hypothetical protein
MTLAARLFENVNYGGRALDIQDGYSSPQLPPPIGNQQASSIQVFCQEWITFWESTNYGDDSLWIAPPSPGHYWPIPNLHILPRPHGNNHWGDRIAAVAFSGPPSGSNEDRTIVWPDGHITVGNRFEMSAKGIWTYGKAEGISLVNDVKMKELERAAA